MYHLVFLLPPGGEVAKWDPHTWVSPNPLIPFCTLFRYTKSTSVMQEGARQKAGPAVEYSTAVISRIISVVLAWLDTSRHYYRPTLLQPS